MPNRTDFECSYLSSEVELPEYSNRYMTAAVQSSHVLEESLNGSKVRFTWPFANRHTNLKAKNQHKTAVQGYSCVGPCQRAMTALAAIHTYQGKFGLLNTKHFKICSVEVHLYFPTWVFAQFLKILPWFSGVANAKVRSSRHFAVWSSPRPYHDLQ